MLQVPVIDLNNNKVGSINLDEKIFGQSVNSALLHETVIMTLNNCRQGTHCTKTRGLVSGGGKKPWRQKGTGRARAGSIRSPLWVGGGTVFGPQPRDYSYRMPKKKSKLALYSALSSKLIENNLIVTDSMEIREGKTKDAVSMLQRLNVIDSVLIICDKKNEALYRGVRNLPEVAIIDVDRINVYDLLRYKNMVISKEDIKKLMEMWA